MKRISYKELNSKQKEIYNFQKVASILADYGYNCIQLADDWQGADFLAYNFDGVTTKRVQLKARLTIAKKYLNKNLYMTFPVNDSWYLIAHDELVELASSNTNWLNTESWNKDGYSGGYSSASPSKKLIESLESYRLN